MSYDHGMTSWKEKVLADCCEPCDILLVEDNPNDAELALRALRKNNIANRIFVVGDGAEALDFLFASGAYRGRDTSEHPKVVLLDLKLPRVSGLQVLERMKRDTETAMIPVVALTSSREDKDIEKCYRLGVNSYIVKPVEFGDFVKAVSELGLYWIALNQSPPC